ncbi:MAG TPA: efflux RND transporter periplasmic adaptor subunit [Candidatus Sumerlaeota bacterium]|nr:efflux RND transporter periplasmic adaptor subunit [Candidatus Sumerlaeota bacterium]
MRSLCVAASLALMTVACSNPTQSKDKNTPDVVVAQKGTLEVAIEELGVVEATRTANIMCPFKGRIVTILESGTHVKKGDVVVRLDVRSIADSLEEEIQNLGQIKKDLEASIQSLEIDLRSNALDVNSATAQLDLARVQLASVNRNLGDLEYLRSENLVEQDKVREAESDLNSTQINTFSQDMTLRGQVTGSQNSEQAGRIDIQRNQLRGEESLSRIRERQEKIESAELKAPVEGLFVRSKRFNFQQRKVVERQAGEEVNMSDQLGSIPDLSGLTIRSQIPESEVQRVSKGSDVKVVLEALGNLEVSGKVSFIGPIAIEREASPGGQLMAAGQALTGEKVFEITVELANADPRLKPGLTARARIVLSRKENVLTVPLEAITTQDNKHFVYIQNNKKYERREVKVGGANSKVVEIVDGVKDGETVFLGTPAASAMKVG